MTDDIRSSSINPTQKESESNDVLRDEFLEMQASAQSAYYKKLTKYKIGIICCMLVFALSILGLIVNNSDVGN